MESNTNLWHTIFAEGHPILLGKQKKYQAIGKGPRCKLCKAPFDSHNDLNENIAIPSNRNPRFCNLCDDFIRKNPGGCKVIMPIIFVDIKGSTSLSDKLELMEYVKIINFFYKITTEIFVQTDGFLIDVIGDEVFSIYPSGFSGIDGDNQNLRDKQDIAAKKAFVAVSKLLEYSLYANNAPYGKFGICLDISELYIGTINGAEDGIIDIRVWGRSVNMAARLCSACEPGEALITLETALKLGLQISNYTTRTLKLRGINEPISAISIK